MIDLPDLGISAIRDGVARREFSCREVVAAFATRVRTADPVLRALITEDLDRAFEWADELDRSLKPGGEVPALAGVPLVLKDNLCTRGLRTTCGSQMLAGWRPPYDATVVARLRQAGAIILGKANMDEFAMGSSTENSGFFSTRNPWDTDRVPGGSSGGAAAAVAARMAAGALGSDTGGSVRQPAAFCGVVGLKPTYGAVSRYGLVAYASSLDQIGPLARRVEDAALLMDAIAGHDSCDNSSAPAIGPPCMPGIAGGVAGLRIGVPREYVGEGIQPGVRGAIEAALEVYRGLGAVVSETSTPHVDYALPSYYIIAPAEASSNLARYDGVRYGRRSSGGEDVISMMELSRDETLGAEVKHRIMLGTYTLSAGYYDAYYHKAVLVRALVREEFERSWERFDLLATPTAPETAFRLGERASDPMRMKLSDVCTIPVNLAGTCAVSIPCGDVNGLPVGLQLIGRPFEEAVLLRAAFAFQEATRFHERRPPEVGGATPESTS